MVAPLLAMSSTITARDRARQRREAARVTRAIAVPLLARRPPTARRRRARSPAPTARTPRPGRPPATAPRCRRSHAASAGAADSERLRPAITSARRRTRWRCASTVSTPSKASPSQRADDLLRHRLAGARTPRPAACTADRARPASRAARRRGGARRRRARSRRAWRSDRAASAPRRRAGRRAAAPAPGSRRRESDAPRTAAQPSRAARATARPKTALSAKACSRRDTGLSVYVGARISIWKQPAARPASSPAAIAITARPSAAATRNRPRPSPSVTPSLRIVLATIPSTSARVTTSNGAPPRPPAPSRR